MHTLCPPLATACAYLVLHAGLDFAKHLERLSKLVSGDVEPPEAVFEWPPAPRRASATLRCAVLTGH